MTSRPKKDIELIVTPNDAILFRGNFTKTVTTVFLEVENPTVIPIAYKVKTTAPRRYCVRPNSGKLAPNDSNQVKILLQPNQNNEDLLKHKFLIQTIDLTDEIFENVAVDDIFKDKRLVAGAASRKLLCKFEAEDEEDEEENQEEEEEQKEAEAEIIVEAEAEPFEVEPPVIEVGQGEGSEDPVQSSQQTVIEKQSAIPEIKTEPETFTSASPEPVLIEQPSEEQLGQDITEPELEKVVEPIVEIEPIQQEKTVLPDSILQETISENRPLPDSILQEIESEHEEVKPVQQQVKQEKELPGIINQNSNISSSIPKTAIPSEPQIINQTQSPKIQIKKPVVEPKQPSKSEISPSKKVSDKNFTTISTEELKRYKNDIQNLKDKIHAKEQEILKANKEKREALQNSKQNKPLKFDEQVKAVGNGQNQNPMQDLVMYRVVFIIAVLAFLFGYLLNGLTCSC